MTEIKVLGQRKNRVTFIEMKSEDLRVIVTNLGCHILSLYAKDRNGIPEDVVLSYEDVEDCQDDDSCMGAVVGRVANRIGGASFTLNGVTYPLKANSGPNHIHGGENGFDHQLFDYQILEDGVRFHYISADMEEGYPGKVILSVTYRLEGDTLHIHYRAKSNQDTILNLTNHSYFNLSGGREKIYHHKLHVAADTIACVDENGLTDGTFLPVEGTPFDFTDFHEVGERINANHAQIQCAGGYDHPFLLNEKENQIVLVHEGSGRKLTISTDMPTVQVYTGNYLAGGCNGKKGKPYENRDGIALETQFLSNSINIETNPDMILRKKEIFESETSYKFEKC